MEQLFLDKKNNGYVLKTTGTIKYDGEFVFKNTEEIALIEFIGLLLLDKKVKATIP